MTCSSNEGFSGTSVFRTSKPDRHDIMAIFLEVALHTYFHNDIHISGSSVAHICHNDIHISGSSVAHLCHNDIHISGSSVAHLCHNDIHISGSSVAHLCHNDIHISTLIFFLTSCEILCTLYSYPIINLYLLKCISNSLWIYICLRFQ